MTRGRILRILTGLGIIGAALGWVLTAPATEPAENLAGLTGDAGRGERVFHLGGCASCHSAPGAQGAERLVLKGGRRFPSPFGTFIAPNISPDPVAGIGGWSALDLVNAMRHGTSPEGRHYFPAFPYTSYAQVPVADIVDLAAFLATLPGDRTPSAAHEVGLPFNIRRSLGGWKQLFARSNWIVDDPAMSDQARAGRAIVEGLGHCGECHTPRNLLGGSRLGSWLGGAPNPVGKGRIPNITPGALNWGKDEIAAYLETGFTPEFDVVGAEMAEVVANMAQVGAADRAAIAAYLKAVPPVASD